jgi:hypothetical protein
MSVADSPHGHSTDSDVQNILQVNWGDRHEAYARTVRNAAVPHRRAALDSCKFGEVDIDFMKEGKYLFSLDDF